MGNDFNGDYLWFCPAAKINFDTPEEKQAYYSKVYYTKLSDIGLQNIFSGTETTVEYTKIDKNYLPDDLSLVVGTPRVIGIVPASENVSRMDLPIVEYAYKTILSFNTNTVYVLEDVPDVVQDILNRALGSSFNAYADIEIVFIKASRSVNSTDKYTNDILLNRTFYITDESDSDHEIEITFIEFGNGSNSYFRLNRGSLDANIEVPVFIMCRYYPTGTAWDGSM